MNENRDRFSDIGDKVAATNTVASGNRFKSAETPEFYKSYTIAAQRTCPVCGEKYTRYSGEMEYIHMLGKKKYIFCSYNCRSKFKREHSEEIEKSIPKKDKRSTHDYRDLSSPFTEQKARQRNQPTVKANKKQKERVILN